MAEDNTARYRPGESYGRAPASDPLAELARLIGQSDPLQDGSAGRHADSSPSAGRFSDPVPSFLTQPAQHSDELYSPRYGEPEPPAYPAPPFEAAPSPMPHATQYPAQDDGSRYASDYPNHNDWPGEPAPDPRSYARNERYEPYVPPRAPAPPAEAFSYPYHANSSAASTGPSADSYGGFGGAPQGFDAPAYANPPYGQPSPLDDDLDDEPQPRRGLLTVAAVLALAVLGTAGAYGYRSLFGAHGAGASPPPVIRASNEPSKVAPAPGTADPSSGKFSYDRFSDAGKDERVVAREEKPVDLSKVAPQRSVFPPPPASGNTPSAAGNAASPGAKPPSAIGDPRRVKTVPIRADQSEATASGPAPLQTAPTPPPPASANARTASNAGDDRSSQATGSRTPLRSSRSTANTNAPLSLSPEANNASATLPPAADNVPTQQAAVAPARAVAAPAATGTFLVQVSSQRSEADAESVYRNLQGKYSSVLGNQPHQVRKADLGAKGVYYRTMVGPFASREAAVQLCTSLKQAGGDCVVQH